MKGVCIMSDKLTLLASDIEAAARALGLAVDEANSTHVALQFLAAREHARADLDVMAAAARRAVAKAIEEGRVLQAAGAAFCAELDRVGGDSRGVRRVLARMTGNGPAVRPRELLPGLLAEIGRALAVVNVQSHGSGGLSPAKLAECLHMDTGTLARYTDDAGVRRPGRGGHNHTYRHTDCIAIAEHVARSGKRSTHRDAAAAFLRETRTKSE